jgi:hypothetical protein
MSSAITLGASNQRTLARTAEPELTVRPAAREEPAARASQLLGDRIALRSWIQAHQPQIQLFGAHRREAEAAIRESRLLPNPILTLELAGQPI